MLRRPSVRPSTISIDFSSETTRPIVTKFHIQLPGPLRKKNCSNGLDYMTKMAAMPIYGKNLKNLFLQNQQTDDLEIWYVVLCTQVLPRLFKLSPWVDLDLFYAKVKFGYIGFCMGKSENYVLFGNYCSHMPLSWYKYSNK